MIRVATSPDFINTLMNHPDIRPTLGCDPDGSVSSAIDISVLIGSPSYYFLECIGGGFMVAHQDGGDWECHAMFLPEYRGAYALAAGRAGLDHAFLHTPCERMFTQAPYSNPRVQLYVRRLGFVRVPDRPSPWRSLGGQGEDFLLTKERWAERRKIEAAGKMEAA